MKAFYEILKKKHKLLRASEQIFHLSLDLKKNHKVLKESEKLFICHWDFLWHSFPLSIFFLFKTCYNIFLSKSY